MLKIQPYWTPRYVLDRLVWEAYQRRNTDKPWLNSAANRLLAELLLPNDTGLEWGSGRSTVWLARHLSHLTSVEHNPEWNQRVRDWLAQSGTTNVDYRLTPVPPGGDAARSSPYVSVAAEFDESSLNFALVDGQQREYCAEAVLPKIAAGGILVIDDANGFFDHPSRAPSNRWNKGPKNQLWADVWKALSTWRLVWTTNGLKDTAVFIRPG